MMDERSKYLRRLILRAMKASRRGHWGSSASLVEIMRVLYDNVAKHNPKNPKDQNRDRIILSKGHGVLAQMALLVDYGYISAEELDRFCQKDGMIGGHPSHKTPGVEFDTGALGHGLALGVGVALAGKMKKQNYRVFVIMGDGECNEGSVWEAALLASKHNLDNLTVIIDRNGRQSAGTTEEICPMGSLIKKWDVFGWFVKAIDGHDLDKLRTRLKMKKRNRPLVIIADTIKGKGISFLENDSAHHRTGMTDEYLAEMEEALA